MALTGPGERALRRIDEMLVPISALQSAKTILLLGADPSAREPVLELRIREAVNKQRARLAVLSSENMALASKAHTALSYPPERFEEYVKTLTSAIGKLGSGDGNADRDGSNQSVGAFASQAFVEGPIVVIYDDTFKGVHDPNGILEAVSDLLQALGRFGAVGTLPLLDDCNSMGARDLRILPPMSNGGTWGPPLVAELTAAPGRVRGAFVLGSNLADGRGAEVVEALRNLDLLVVSELVLTDTARLADVILPAASFAEKSGTFTNTERRIQRINETVPSPGIARSDWEMLVDLSQYFERPLDFASVGEIWDDIRLNVPRYASVSYDDVGLSGVRPAADALQAV
jgi:predicted molibdopterin-dependent oxidoreductase YjgC